MNLEFVEKIIKKLYKHKEADKILLVLLNDKLNPKLINKNIEVILKKENIDKKYVIIDKNNLNIEDSPIYYILRKTNNEWILEDYYYNGYKLEKTKIK